MKHFAIAVLATFSIVLATVPFARAQSTSCSTIVTGPATIRGGLVVPSGADCTLDNGVTVAGNVDIQPNAILQVRGQASDHTTIFGNVQVEAGASLLSSGGTILGNISANQCTYVALGAIDDAIIVGGNLQIQGCSIGGAGQGYSGYPNPGDPYSVTIRGNVQCDNNSSSCYLVGSVVGGNVEVNSNGPSPSVVGGNTIYGNLQCQGNASVTNVLVGTTTANTVIGNEQGQCAGL